MKKFKHFIIGTIFLVFGGLIYSIERIIQIIYWSVQRASAIGGGSYPTEPTMPSITDNFFIIIFLIIGIIFFLSGIKSKIK